MSLCTSLTLTEQFSEKFNYKILHYLELNSSSSMEDCDIVIDGTANRRWEHCIVEVSLFYINLILQLLKIF